MDLKFLTPYIIPNESQSSNEEYQEYKHHFFPLDNDEITLIEKEILVPTELREFYLTVGYGFFFPQDDSSFDRLLDVISYKKINLRQNYYEFDPDLDLYSHSKYDDRLIFFEVNEGVYLLIAKEAIEGKNAIYYFDEKIADSLEEFLIRFDQEGHYFEE